MDYVLEMGQPNSGSGQNFLMVQIQIGSYAYLKHKYQLEPLVGIQLTFSHLRPSNFPTIRLAQFAQLCIKNSLTCGDLKHEKTTWIESL